MGSANPTRGAIMAGASRRGKVAAQDK